MTSSSQFRSPSILIAVVLLMSASAHAADATAERNSSRVRYEIAFGFNSWTALDDLQPVANGKFDDVGYSLGGAIHWPLIGVGEGDLLLGVDFGILNNESDILLVTDILIARGLYLVPSFKWWQGDTRRLTLDGGLGFYLVDIAEVAGGFQWIETEVWEQSSVGGFIGGTWHFGPASSDKNRGATLSFKVHYFDLGVVVDEGPLLPVRLGANAGKLSGPVYQLQLGHRWD